MNTVTMRLVSIAAYSMAVALMFAGCASAPQEEIDATQAAIIAAATEDVQAYAPEVLKEAHNTLAKAIAEVQTQNGKFALSRDYKGASDLLRLAKDKIATAATVAKAEKEELIAQWQGFQTTLPNEIRILNEKYAALSAMAKQPRVVQVATLQIGEHSETSRTPISGVSDMARAGIQEAGVSLEVLIASLKVANEQVLKG